MIANLKGQSKRGEEYEKETPVENVRFYLGV